jgi:hypothetical protein
VKLTTNGRAGRQQAEHHHHVPKEHSFRRMPPPSAASAAQGGMHTCATSTHGDRPGQQRDHAEQNFLSLSTPGITATANHETTAVHHPPGRLHERQIVLQRARKADDMPEDQPAKQEPRGSACSSACPIPPAA